MKTRWPYNRANSQAVMLTFKK